MSEDITLMKYIVEDCPINWESQPIRETIRKAQAEGHHPSRLLLGHCEAGSLRRFLNENFEASVPNSLRDTYYLGLKVEETDEEHLIAIDGEKRFVEPKNDLPPLESNQPPQWHDKDPIAEKDKASSELEFKTSWDAPALRKLITKKSAVERIPAFLFLGRHEAMLLRVYLNADFGPSTVRSLKNVYYMGLEVIEVDTDRFLRTAGSKRVKSFQDSLGRRPKWKELQYASSWQFRAT